MLYCVCVCDNQKHAFALELADVAISNIEQPRILDVGAGSGYLTACLGRMVRPKKREKKQLHIASR